MVIHLQNHVLQFVSFCVTEHSSARIGIKHFLSLEPYEHHKEWQFCEKLSLAKWYLLPHLKTNSILKIDIKFLFLTAMLTSYQYDFLLTYAESLLEMFVRKCS